MRIEILGSRSAKFKKLAKMVEVSTKKLQLEAEIVKITAITEIRPLINKLATLNQCI